MKIHKEGHEIACQGYSHEYIYKQTPGIFTKETRRAKDILTDLVDDEIKGYRAASWSIIRDSLWALDIIRNTGFKYDSSIYPTKNKRYGFYNTPAKPYQITFPDSGKLLEIPPLTLRVGKLKLPVGGGVYLRVFPLWLHKLAIRRSNNTGLPGSVMLHPHELDPDPPRLKVNLVAWLIKYFRIRKVKSILENILAEYRSITYNEFLRDYDTDKLPKTFFQL